MGKSSYDWFRVHGHVSRSKSRSDFSIQKDWKKKFASFLEPQKKVVCNDFSRKKKQAKSFLEPYNEVVLEVR